jgi:NAD-dependent SIR2 family protein deacetylase
MFSGIRFFKLGSGASADSGLPTYRGPNGIYNDNYDPESYYK